LPGKEGIVYFLVYSPDGKMLATSGEDQKLRLWDTADYRRTPRELSADDTLVCAAFAPDGQTLVCGGRASLTVWDLATGKSRAIDEAQGGQVRSVIFASDGKTLFSARREDPALAVWNTTTWAVSRAESAPGRIVVSAALSADGKTLAAGSNGSPGGESTLALFDAATFKRREGVAMIEQAIGPLAFSPDGKLLAASTLRIPGQVVLCEAASGREIRRLELPAFANGLAFAPDSKTLAVGTREGTIILFDPGNGSMRGTFTAHSSQITRLAYAPDGRTVASADIEGTIKLWWVGK
jgi:WD40 repeat protein